LSLVADDLRKAPKATLARLARPGRKGIPVCKARPGLQALRAWKGRRARPVLLRKSGSSASIARCSPAPPNASRRRCSRTPIAASDGDRQPSSPKIRFHAESRRLLRTIRWLRSACERRAS